MPLASILRVFRTCLAYLFKRPANYPRYRLRLEELERREVPAAALTPPLYLDFSAGNAPSAVVMTAADQGGDSTKDAANLAQAYRSVSGIYSLGIPDGIIPQSVLDNPYVDGIALRATWDHIETAEGVYDWSYLDSQVEAATAAGKKVSLSIASGVDTPTWLYDEGAASFTYVDKNSPTAHVIPVPWDPIFLGQWQEFVEALGTRYAANPTVVSVKITGINTATEETMLPHSMGQTVTNGTDTWTTTNDVVNWQSMGYTRQKVEDAWLAIADSFSQAFPASRICLMIVPSAFPPIDNSGQVIAGSGDNQTVNDLIGLGTARFGDQFVVQNNGLSDFWVSSQVASAAPQVTTGYQMLWRVTNDSTGRMDDWTPGFDPQAVLQAAVDKGVAANARYLEVYQMDILNADLQDVLAMAHARTANVPPTVMIMGVPASAPTAEATITLSSQVADCNLVDMAAGFSYTWTATRKGKVYAAGSDATFTFAPTENGVRKVNLIVTDTDAGQASTSTLITGAAFKALAGYRTPSTSADIADSGSLAANDDFYPVGFAKA